MWFATISMAFRALRRNVLRSVLTTLGIVIGVASVIAMLTLGASATTRITNEIGSLGTNLLIITPGGDFRIGVGRLAAPFKLDDLRLIRQEMPELAGVAPVSASSVLAVYGNNNYRTGVEGSTNDYFRVRNSRISRGRDFSDEELSGGTAACVLGDTVRRKLFGAQDPLGATIRLDKTACTVIGLVEAKGKSTFGRDQDDFIVMPILAVQRRLAGNAEVGTIFVSAQSEGELHGAQMKLKALFRERRRVPPGQKDDFDVDDTREIAKTVGNVTGIMTALLGAVAAISLLVGGIGIMNIMLVSVTERTREIGIRLAIGALAREVLLQFLIEAIVLCSVGGLLGVALGLAGSYAGTRALSFPLMIDPISVVVAFGFSALIGIAFGYLPARKAARLDPIEALRHE